MPSPDKVVLVNAAGGRTEAFPVVGQGQLANFRFSSVALAEAATFSAGDVCEVDVAATGKTTTYAYSATSGATRDGISVLNTGAGGATRLLATGTYSADVLVDAAGSSNYSSAKELQKIIGSTGLASGGGIVYTSLQRYTVQAGTGILRSSNSDDAPLYLVNWPAVTDREIADGATEYVFVSWNSGTPAISFKSSYSNNSHNEFNLGSVIREGTALHILPAPDMAANYSAKNSERQRHKGFEVVAGLVISSVGTRGIYCTAGEAYLKVQEIMFDAFDTTASGTFDAYVRSTKDSAGNTQWDNQNYDLGGVKTALGSSKWGVHWVYRCACGGLATVYGSSNAPTQTEAEQEGTPQILPARLAEQGFLLGRIVFQKGAPVGTFEPVQRTTFNLGEPTSHEDLPGLQGGTTGQHYHLTEAEHDKLPVVVATEVAAASELTTLASDDKFPLIDVSETPDLLKWISKANLALALELTSKRIVQVVFPSSTSIGYQDLSPTYADLSSSSITFTPRFASSKLVYVLFVQVASLDPGEGCVIHFKVLSGSTTVFNSTARRGTASASGEGIESIVCEFANGGTTEVTLKTQVREYSGSLDSIAGGTYSMDGATSRQDVQTFAMILEIGA